MRSFFFLTAGMVFLLTAFAKAITIGLNAPILKTYDPFSGLTFYFVFVVGASGELLLALYCLLSKNYKNRAIAILWTCSVFVLYRVGLRWSGYSGACPCLGTFTDALTVSPTEADALLRIVIALLCAGALLILAERRFSDTKTNDLIVTMSPINKYLLYFGLGLLLVIFVLGSLKRWTFANEQQLATAEVSQLREHVRMLEGKLATEKTHAQAAEADVGQLLTSIKTGTSTVDGKAPTTLSEYEMRRRTATEMIKAGKYSQALEVMLWCYKNSDVTKNPGMSKLGLRRELAQLAEVYPEATVAMQALRDSALESINSTQGNHVTSGLLSEYADLNKKLQTPDQTLLLYDSLPLDDARRRLLGQVAFTELVANQRYGDAINARPFGSIITEIDLAAQTMGQLSQPADQLKMINTLTGYAEALAGAGKIDEAQIAAGRILSASNTEQTKALLISKFIRSGHPELGTQISR